MLPKPTGQGSSPKLLIGCGKGPAELSPSHPPCLGPLGDCEMTRGPSGDAAAAKPSLEGSRGSRWIYRQLCTGDQAALSGS